MRALVVSGAMIVACQSASDARASRAADSAKARTAATRDAYAGRDSVPGFTVPAQCARGSVPMPKTTAPLRVASAPKTKADSATRARADSMHMTVSHGSPCAKMIDDVS